MKRKAILYIHGKGGCAAEAEHYRALFPDWDVGGLDYHGDTPWDTEEEIRMAVLRLADAYPTSVVIANSIGAYFLMNAVGGDCPVTRALFISPIVDMERLILDMMDWANVGEDELRARGVIETGFGEALSWEYLAYVREHPVTWRVPTDILYAGGDNLTARETVTAFAQRVGASLTVMENGEHWFHTEEQMAFLDRWAREKGKRRR